MTGEGDEHTLSRSETLGQIDERDAKGRRVVLHPRTAAARRLGRARARGGFVRGRAVEDAEVSALVERQLRATAATASLLVVPLLLLPLLFAGGVLVDTRLAGVPLPWLLLGPLVFPWFWALGRRHERRAHEIEDRWERERC